MRRELEISAKGGILLSMLSKEGVLVGLDQIGRIIARGKSKWPQELCLLALLDHYWALRVRRGGLLRLLLGGGVGEDRHGGVRVLLEVEVVRVRGRELIGSACLQKGTAVVGDQALVLAGWILIVQLLHHVPVHVRLVVRKLVRKLNGPGLLRLQVDERRLLHRAHRRVLCKSSLLLVQKSLLDRSRLLDASLTDCHDRPRQLTLRNFLAHDHGLPGLTPGPELHCGSVEVLREILLGYLRKETQISAEIGVGV